MNDRDQKKKKFTPGTLAALVIVVALANPELLGILLVLACIAAPFVVLSFVVKNSKGGTAKKPAANQQRFPLDDCPKPMCFHKDKGEHHVRKCREIDPWDRPDIDISKYQRRQ